MIYTGFIDYFATGEGRTRILFVSYAMDEEEFKLDFKNSIDQYYKNDKAGDFFLSSAEIVSGLMSYEKVEDLVSETLWKNPGSKIFLHSYSNFS